MTIATKVWIVQLIELYVLHFAARQPAVGGRVRAGGLLAQRRPQHQHPHLRGGASLHRHRAQPPRLQPTSGSCSDGLQIRSTRQT